jgi:hypothetical protein
MTRSDALGVVGISKHTVDEGVQDGHGTGGDTSVGVNLLEH